MANSGKRSFVQELNIWVQTIGIIIAALWGGYTFIYKEIKVPKSAPVNITLNLDLKKIGTANLKNDNRNKRLVPVELKVSAKNPSSREVYLLTSAWIVTGLKIVPKAQSFSEKDIISEKNRCWYKEKHSACSSATVVALGGLFPDSSLKPNEMATRTLIIYLPPDEYDVLVVEALMPTVGKKNVLTAEWQLNEKDMSLIPTLYRLRANGERKEIKRDEDGGYSDEKLELQMADSISMLSLWQ